MGRCYLDMDSGSNVVVSEVVSRNLVAVLECQLVAVSGAQDVP